MSEMPGDRLAGARCAPTPSWAAPPASPSERRATGWRGQNEIDTHRSCAPPLHPDAGAIRLAGARNSATPMADSPPPLIRTPERSGWRRPGIARHPHVQRRRLSYSNAGAIRLAGASATATPKGRAPPPLHPDAGTIRLAGGHVCHDTHRRLAPASPIAFR